MHSISHKERIRFWSSFLNSKCFICSPTHRALIRLSLPHSPSFILFTVLHLSIHNRSRISPRQLRNKFIEIKAFQNKVSINSRPHFHAKFRKAQSDDNPILVPKPWQKMRSESRMWLNFFLDARREVAFNDIPRLLIRQCALMTGPSQWKENV